MSVTISFEQWAAEVNRLDNASDDGFQTVAELSAATNIAPKAVLKYLKTAKAGGRLQCRRVYRRSVDDRLAQVPGYKITKGKEK